MDPWKIILGTAAIITALGIIRTSPVGRLVRWLIRRNITEPLSAASRRLVHDTVRPMVDEVKANARQQHDEQNQSLQVIKSTLAGHGSRLSLIEDHITRPKG